MEAQSYKIYFNDGALVIADSPEALRGLGNLYFIGDDELQKSFKILLSSQNNGKPLHFGLICPDPRATILQFMEDFTVMEETGINMINISDKIGETYHVYYEDDILLLKETHWYLMNSHGKGTLKPQQEEGISEVKFADLDWFKTTEFNSYQSVHDVLRKCVSRFKTSV